MAKQNNSAKDSNFDFSKFIDLDDEDLVKSSKLKDRDFDVLPYSRSQIVTGSLEVNLKAEVERYMNEGKLPRNVKKNLRKLSDENHYLEDDLKQTDESILERADGYDRSVSIILKERDDLEKMLDDTDPYDSEPASVNDKSPESKEVRIHSSDLFKELEKLESHRTKLNSRRLEVLTGVKNIANQKHNSSWDNLDEIVSEKIDAINEVQDITKANFSEEEKSEFEDSVEQLTDYISGNFNPLTDTYDEDDYDEDEDITISSETPLSTDGHSVKELEAIVKASFEPESNQSFGELFIGVEEPEDSLTDDDVNQESPNSEAYNAFSSSESEDELLAALGKDEFDPEPQSDDEDIADNEDNDEQELNGASTAAGSSLSDTESENDGYVVSEESNAQTVAYDNKVNDKDSLTSEDPQILNFEAEGGPVLQEEEQPHEETSVKTENLSEDIEGNQDSAPSVTVDLIADLPVDSNNETRALIFEELKLQYGLSFDFEHND